MKKMVKRPYYNSEFSQWAVESFNDDNGEFSGKNIGLCDTEAEALRSFQRKIDAGYEVAEEIPAANAHIFNAPTASETQAETISSEGMEAIEAAIVGQPNEDRRRKVATHMQAQGYSMAQILDTLSTIVPVEPEVGSYGWGQKIMNSLSIGEARLIVKLAENTFGGVGVWSDNANHGRGLVEKGYVIVENGKFKLTSLGRQLFEAIK